jgi:hypothetical protein
MEKITTSNATQIMCVRFACPQAADRSLNADVRGGTAVRVGFSAAKFYATKPNSHHVAYFRSGRPPV